MTWHKFKHILGIFLPFFKKHEPSQVHVSARGSLYMDPEEFFKSPKVQAEIDEMIRLADNRSKMSAESHNQIPSEQIPS